MENDIADIRKESEGEGETDEVEKGECGDINTFWFYTYFYQ